jgi:hypothetical protein
LDEPDSMAVQYAIDEVLKEEIEVCIALETPPNEVTWALACEQSRRMLGPLVLAYGKGRIYGSDE